MDGDITQMGVNIGKRILGMTEVSISGRILPAYFIEAGGSGRTLSAGCIAGRAYIGISDDGAIGDVGMESTDGRILPIYKIGETGVNKASEGSD